MDNKKIDGISKIINKYRPDDKKIFSSASKKLDGLSMAGRNDLISDREIVRQEISACEKKNQRKSKDEEAGYGGKAVAGMEELEARSKKEEDDEKKSMEIKKKEEYAEKEERRKGREQFKIDFKKNIFIFLSYFKRQAFAGLKILFVFSSIAMISVLIIYLGYSFLILRIGADNDLTGYINKFVPVPAIITTNGIITYARYNTVREAFPGNNEINPAESVEKKALAELLVGNLYKKYKSESISGQDGLNRLVLLDERINQVALARINKIKSEIDKNDFESIYRKYGDGYGSGEYITRLDASKKFNNSLVDYGGDKLSPILIGQDGYYIVKVVDNRVEPIGIKYVYVKGKTLDNYLEEEAKEIKTIKLIK